MELSIITAKAIAKLFIVMGVGYVAAKGKILNKEASGYLSSVILYISSPLMILNSFFGGYDPVKAKGLFQAFLIGSIVILLTLLISVFAFKKGPDHGMECLCAAFGNYGYLGMPLVNELLGSEGVLYVSGLVTAFVVWFWSFGIMVLLGKFDKTSVKKVFTNPNMIAVFVGIIVYISRINLPAVITDPVSMVSNCNTPLSMIVAGVTVALNPMGPIFKKAGLYKTLIIKHFVAPLLVIPCILIMDLPYTLALACYVGLACPVAVLSAMVSVKNGKDEAYGFGMFSVSTLFCIISIPIMVMLLSVFVKY